MAIYGFVLATASGKPLTNNLWSSLTSILSSEALVDASGRF